MTDVPWSRQLFASQHWKFWINGETQDDWFVGPCYLDEVYTKVLEKFLVPIKPWEFKWAAYNPDTGLSSGVPKEAGVPGYND